MKLRSIERGTLYPADTQQVADDQGGLLEVDLDIPPVSRDLFDERLGSLDPPLRSGVWRFRELLPNFPDDVIVSRPEGNTNLYQDARLDDIAGTEVWFKHEGENPTGSFKDRGMTVGVSHARWIGASVVACASTGNTSASVASYASAAGLPSVVFVPEGKISVAKLAQTIAYGAKILQVRGDFDAAMDMVRSATERYGLYLLNSLNPFRLEGQKSIFLEAIQQRRWQVPDWVVLPGGNLGNVSALGKAIREAYNAGLIDRMPRVAVVQAAGAAPFAAAFAGGFGSLEPVSAETVASAISIGNPVNYAKAWRVIRETEGLVLAVPDSELLDAKASIDRVGIGCEPASAAGLAGIQRLVRDGTIAEGETVLTILTGNLMKDSDTVINYHLSDERAAFANLLIVIDATCWTP
ncbi:MAG: threonine synthase [Thermomicrobiales bacterium]